MIIAQIVLIIILLLMGMRFISSRSNNNTRAYKKLLLIVFMFSAIIIVLFPELSNDIAKLLGIGRGADLLLYGVTVVVIFQLLNTYIKDKEDQRRIVFLARKIAIIEANQRDKNKK